jgi:hypothetical protein
MSYLKIQQEFDPGGALSKERLLETPPGSLLAFGKDGEAKAVPAQFNYVVDGTYGNDAKGGRFGGAFKTLTAARDAAVADGASATSQVTIIVQPGSYTANDLLRTGVNWYFWLGSSVTWTHAVSGSDFGIFDDRVAQLSCTTTSSSTALTVSSTSGLAAGDQVYGTGIAESCTISAILTSTTLTLSAAATASGTVTLSFSRAVTSHITGFGDFDYNGNKALTARGILVVYNRNSVVRFQAYHCTTRSFTASSGLATASIIDCSRVFIGIESIRDNGADDPELDEFDDPIDSSTMGIFWQKGDIYASVRRISTQSYCLWGQEPFIGSVSNFWFNGDYMESLVGNAVYVQASNGAGSGANYRCWIRSQQVHAAIGTALSLLGSAKTYCIAEKISGLNPISSSGVLWLICQKMTLVSGSVVGFITQVDQATDVSDASDSYISVQHYEDLSSGSYSQSFSMLFNMTHGGKAILNGGTLKTGATGGGAAGGVKVTAGAVTLQNMRIDSSGTNNSASRPVTVAANTLTLWNCYLVCPALALESVYAAGAQTIINKGSCANVAKHANITVSGEALVISSSYT